MKQNESNNITENTVYKLTNKDGITKIVVKSKPKCRLVASVIENNIEGAIRIKNKPLEFEVKGKKYTGNSKKFGSLAHDLWDLVDEIPEGEVIVKPEIPLRKAEMIDYKLTGCAVLPKDIVTRNKRINGINDILQKAMREIDLLC